MHAVECLVEFLCVRLVDRLDGALELWSGIFDEVKHILAAFCVEGITGADILHLHCGADVAGFELVDISADLTAYAI